MPFYSSVRGISWGNCLMAAFVAALGYLSKIYQCVLSEINLCAVAKSEDVATYGFD